ncbi:MAG: hypothetical protein NUV61_00525 [Candidatus Azambacteria bacterium]|nr:hypothetical protein [Candidatus Azambacteria bacterium]
MKKEIGVGDEMMLEFFVQNGLFYEAQKVIESSGRNMSSEELRTVIRACFARELLLVANDAIILFPEGGEKNYFFRMLIVACLKKNLLDIAGKVIALLPQGKKTDFLINLHTKTCIENGNLREAIEAKKLIGKELEQEEIEEIIVFCLDNCLPSEASRAVKLLYDEGARERYHKKILHMYLEDGLYESARGIARELNLHK